MTRAFAEHELAARAWYYLSPFKDERSIAARRFREIVAELGAASAEHVLHVIGELALDGAHAKTITARVVNDRARRIDSGVVADHVSIVLEDLVARMRMSPRGAR